MTSTYEYFMWQQNSSTTTSTVQMGKIFNIHLQFHHLLELYYPENAQISLATINKSYPLPRNQFLNQDSRATIIRTLLSTTGVSMDFIESVISDISSFILDMISHPSNSNLKVITMSLAIFVVTPYDNHQEIDRALREIMQENNNNNARFTPASESCIQGLKRVKLINLDDSCSNKKCIICLEKQLVGQEIIGLPCGHDFHGDCIVRWLETSHLCPLCRYSMS